MIWTVQIDNLKGLLCVRRMNRVANARITVLWSDIGSG